MFHSKISQFASPFLQLYWGLSRLEIAVSLGLEIRFRCQVQEQFFWGIQVFFRWSQIHCYPPSIWLLGEGLVWGPNSSRGGRWCLHSSWRGSNSVRCPLPKGGSGILPHRLSLKTLGWFFEPQVFRQILQCRPCHPLALLFWMGSWGCWGCSGWKVLKTTQDFLVFWRWLDRCNQKSRALSKVQGQLGD